MSIQNVCSSSPASCISSVSSYSTEAVEAGSGLTSTSLPEDSLLINILNSGDSPEVQALEERRSQATNEFNDLRGQSQDTQTQIVSRKESIIGEQMGDNPFGESQAEYEDAKADFEYCSSCKEQSQQDMEQFSQELQTIRPQREAVSQQLQQISSDLSTAQSERDSLAPPTQPGGDDEQAQADYQAQLQAYEAKKSELESRVSALQQQQQQLQAENNQLIKKEIELGQRENVAQAEVLAYDMSAQAAQAKMMELQQSVADENPEVQNAMDEDSDLQAMQDEYEQLQQQISEKQDEINQLYEQISELKGYSNSLDDSGPSQSELAAQWAEDDGLSDEEKLMAAMEAEGFEADEEEGVIHIGGTDGDDDIDITMGADGSYRVIVNGEETVYSAEEAKRLMVDSGSGDDKIRVHYDEETASFIDDIDQNGGSGDDRQMAKGGFGSDTTFGEWVTGSFNGAEEKKAAPQPAVYINGGDGNDVIEADENVNTQLFITGGDGDDKITGGSANDVIIDNLGSNTIEGGLGDDVMITGDGSDIITDRGGRNIIYSKGGEDNINLYDPSRYGETEQQKFNSHNNSEVHSGGGDDVITVHDGTNTIDSDDGDDRIIVYNGDNTVRSGDGDDNVTVFNGSNTVDAGDGEDKVKVYNGNNLVYGGADNDDITVVDGINIVHGQSGDDHIKAYHGDQVLCGEDGDDDIEGGDGRDYIEGGDGDDTIDGGEGGDVVFAGDGNDTVNGGDGDDYINGGGGDDVIHGDAGSDILFGLSGDDELYGDEGTDTLSAGDGNDKVDGGADADIIRYTDSDEHGHDEVLNADPNDDAKVLEPIDIPYNFKIEPLSEYGTTPLGFMIFPMEEEAARAFESVMRDNLEAFASIEPGQEMLLAIADTGHTVKIRHMSEPNGYCRGRNDQGEGHSKVNADGSRGEFEPGKGCDSVLGINPYFIDYGSISEEAGALPFAEQNTTTVMGHELNHAYDNATGYLDGDYYDNDTGEWLGQDPGGNNRAVMGAELQAVGLHEENLPYANPYGLTENDLREYFHMNPRDSYYAYKKEE